MNATATRIAAAVLAFAVLPPFTLALGEDAGTGSDAGGSRETATAVSYGMYGGYVASRNDVDWYRAPGSSGPACVEGRLAAQENPLEASAGVEYGSAAALAGFTVARNSSRAFGVAGHGFSGAVLGVRALDDNTGAGVPSRPGPYAFWWALVQPSGRASQDALTGRDAPATTAEATPVGPGCVAGRLDPFSSLGGDAGDAYRLVASAGDLITFSLAAPNSAAISVSLVDAAGTALTPAIGANGMASYAVPTDGSYYLVASRSSMASLEDIAYQIGVIVGPPGCKPNC